MKRIILAFSLLVVLVSGCRTSEANYRAAYEKAVAARTGDDGSLDTRPIYGAQSRRPDATYIIHDGDTVEVSVKMVSLMRDGYDASAVALKRYMVVVGQFKQRFNALSLRQRVADAGYGDACVVETAEPYCYIVAASFPTAAEARNYMQRFSSDAPIALKPPLPFILTDPRTK